MAAASTKRTAIGDLPPGWTIRTVSEFATKVGSGATPLGGKSVYLAERVSHALIRSQHVFDRHFDTAELAYISEEHSRELRNAEVRSGDVLLNITGDGVTFARACLVPDEILPACVNQHVSIIRVNRELCEPGYLLSFLTHPLAKRYMESFNTGGSRRAITKGHIESFEIPLPQMPVQRRIAGILSAYDELIENSQRRIRILEAMAHTPYREWFVHFRIPAEVLTKAGASPKIKLVASPLGDIPQGWEVKKLKEVCRLTMGQSPKSEFYNETGEGQHFHQGVTDFGDRFPADRLFCTVEGRIAEAGDILFSVRAPVGRMNIADKKIIIGRGLSAIRHNDGHQAFLWEQLRSRFTEDDMMGNGAIFAAVTKDDMQGIEILCPPQPLVASAEKHFVPIHDEIGNLTRQIQNLRRTRDLLLPRLLSGRVELAREAA